MLSVCSPQVHTRIPRKHLPHFKMPDLPDYRLAPQENRQIWGHSPGWLAASSAGIHSSEERGCRRDVQTGPGAFSPRQVWGKKGLPNYCHLIMNSPAGRLAVKRCQSSFACVLQDGTLQCRYAARNLPVWFKCLNVDTCVAPLAHCPFITFCSPEALLSQGRGDCLQTLRYTNTPVRWEFTPVPRCRSVTQ